MDAKIEAQLGRHHLVTRRFAIKNGMPPEVVDRLVRSGRWVAVWRGVYAPAEFWDSLDQYVGRPLHRSRAASAHMYSPHVMSHDSAALELGLLVLDAPGQLVHVTRDGVVGSRHRHGVKHHKAPYRPDQIVFVEGRPVLDRARTVVDIARDRGLAAGVVAADSALRQGVTRRQLEEALEPMGCWPHVRLSREVVDLADGRAESAGESLTRVLVKELDLGEPEPQFGLSDGHVSVWCDLRVGRQVIEFDGRVKFRLVKDGGVADKDPAQVLWEEKKRQDFVTGFGLGMSRVTWVDLTPARREATKVRLRREIETTSRLLGDDIGDLAAFIIRSRPLRAA
jgi:hypothetical protein